LWVNGHDFRGIYCRHRIGLNDSENSQTTREHGEMMVRPTQLTVVHGPEESSEFGVAASRENRSKYSSLLPDTNDGGMKTRSPQCTVSPVKRLNLGRNALRRNCEERKAGLRGLKPQCVMPVVFPIVNIHKGLLSEAVIEFGGDDSGLNTGRQGPIAVRVGSEPVEE
jgi:hypothetical protein